MGSLAKKILGAIEIPFWLGFILLYPLLLIPYGLNYTDGPFHYVAFMGLRCVDSLTFLYPLPGKLWMVFFGASMLSFRVLWMVLVLLLSTLPAIVILGKESSWRVILRVTGLFFIFWANKGGAVLSWDIYSLFLLALILIFVHRYIGNPSARNLAVLGLLTGIVTGFRFPSVLIGLPILLVVLLKNIHQHKGFSIFIKHTIIFAFTAVVIYAALWWIYLFSEAPSCPEGKMSVIATIVNRLTDQHDSHTLYILLAKYLRDTVKIIPMFGLLIFLAFAWKYAQGKPTIKYLIQASAIAVLISYFILFLSGSAYGKAPAFFISAFTIALCLVLGYISFTRGEQDKVLLCLYVFLSGFITIAGSNTGLLKMQYPYLIALPILLVYTTRVIPRADQLGLSILVSLLFVFQLTEKWVAAPTYEDATIPKLQAVVDHPLLSGIRTTPLRKKQIEEILTIYDRIKVNDPKAGILFYGQRSWLFRYLTQEKEQLSVDFHMKYDDPRGAQMLAESLGIGPGNKYVFLLFNYPEEAPPAKGGDLVREVLIKKAYRPQKEGNNYQLWVQENNRY